jgi:hypothetical protein
VLTGLPRTLLAAGFLGALLSVTGCTGSPSPTAPPSTSPLPSSTSASPAPPEQQLQQLAALGTKAAFHATFAVRQSHPASHATWQVWRTPTSLRVDVVTKGVTATLIVTPHATYSCRKPHRTCFTVARGDKPIPVPVRLLAEQLFSADLTTLATHPAAFSVTSMSDVQTFGHCFEVAPSGGNKSAVDKAEYCFNDAGLLTRVRYPNGNLVQLEHSSAQTPKHSVFVPYSSPTPLPK